MKYARIQDDVAVEVSINPSEQFHPDLAAQFEPVPEEVEAGWVRSDGTWSPPAEPEPLTWDNAPAEYWWVEVGSFYDRFGEAKIPVLASANPTVQALVRDTQVRKYIDLKRADVQQFVEFLGTVIPEVTPEIREAVLGHTTDEERYIKGLPQPVEVEE